jgi:hypothetical protein
VERRLKKDVRIKRGRKVAENWEREEIEKEKWASASTEYGF